MTEYQQILEAKADMKCAIFVAVIDGCAKINALAWEPCSHSLIMAQIDDVIDDAIHAALTSADFGEDDIALGAGKNAIKIRNEVAS